MKFELKWQWNTFVRLHMTVNLNVYVTEGPKLNYTRFSVISILVLSSSLWICWSFSSGIIVLYISTVWLEEIVAVNFDTLELTLILVLQIISTLYSKRIQIQSMTLSIKTSRSTENQKFFNLTVYWCHFQFRSGRILNTLWWLIAWVYLRVPMHIDFF